MCWVCFKRLHRFWVQITTKLYALNASKLRNAILPVPHLQQVAELLVLAGCSASACVSKARYCLPTWCRMTCRLKSSLAQDVSLKFRSLSACHAAVLKPFDGGLGTDRSALTFVECLQLLQLCQSSKAEIAAGLPLLDPKDLLRQEPESQRSGGSTNQSGYLMSSLSNLICIETTEPNYRIFMTLNFVCIHI